MADVLHMGKARQEVALDDSPGSPVFSLDLTDAGMERMVRGFSDASRRFRAACAGADGSGGDGRADALGDAVAGLYRDVICACLGEGAYEATVRYIGGDGMEPREYNTAIAPLASWCAARVVDVRRANDEAAYALYLGMAARGGSGAVPAQA